MCDFCIIRRHCDARAYRDGLSLVDHFLVQLNAGSLIEANTQNSVVDIALGSQALDLVVSYKFLEGLPQSMSQSMALCKACFHNPHKPMIPRSFQRSDDHLL
jgi:hypothetical protein